MEEKNLIVTLKESIVELKKSIEEKDELLWVFQTNKLFDSFEAKQAKHELYSLQSKNPSISITDKIIDLLFEAINSSVGNPIQLQKAYEYAKLLPLLQSHQINKIFDDGHTLLTKSASLHIWSIVDIFLQQPFVNIMCTFNNMTVMDYASETNKILEEYETNAKHHHTVNIDHQYIDDQYVEDFNHMIKTLVRKKEFSSLHAKFNAISN